MRVIAAAAAILLSQVQDNSCATAPSTGFNCHVSSRGLQNENGLVTDVLYYWCKPPPQEQQFIGWIDARPGIGQEWNPAGREATQFIPAGTTLKELRVEGGRCQPDVEYGTMWRSEGVAADGRPFDETPKRHIFTKDDLC